MVIEEKDSAGVRKRVRESESRVGGSKEERSKGWWGWERGGIYTNCPRKREKK